jgi:hypothetical protein
MFFGDPSLFSLMTPGIFRLGPDSARLGVAIGDSSLRWRKPLPPSRSHRETARSLALRRDIGNSCGDLGKSFTEEAVRNSRIMNTYTKGGRGGRILLRSGGKTAH